MNNLPPKLQDKLKQRELSNSLRTLSGTSDLIDFSSNDYLGFSRSSDINERALAILNNEGNLKNGATGSRLLTGNHELYTRAEQRIAHFHSSDTALIFNSGYDANLGLLGSIGLRGDVLLYDELCHASIRDGLQLGKANSYKFKHNDLNDLRAVTARVLNDQKNDGQVYVVTESVFSMDGDSPNLNELCQWCEEKEYRLIVDEAHAVGVAGPKGAGLMDTWGLTDKVFARIVTFGKALGVHGAAVLCGHELREFLINFARSFIYTTGLPPHSVAAVIAAYEKLEKDVSGINKLHRNIELLRSCLENSKLSPAFIPSESAIHCCVISGNDQVKIVAKVLQQKGFDVRPILSPTVPQGKERLRICLHSFNSEEDIERLVTELQHFINSDQLDND